MDEVNDFIKRTKVYNLGWFLFKLSLVYVFYIGSTTEFSNGQNSDVLTFILIFCVFFPFVYSNFKPQIKCSSCNENLSGTYTQSNLKVVTCPYCSKSVP